jgi:hypothetical protein
MRSTGDVGSLIYQEVWGGTGHGEDRIRDKVGGTKEVTQVGLGVRAAGVKEGARAGEGGREVGREAWREEGLLRRLRELEEENEDLRERIRSVLHCSAV